MITGFENYTRDLTDYENDELLPIIVQGMKKKIGSANAIKNGTAIASLKKKGYKISDARFRKLMHIIRVSGMIEGIVATSNGYYIAQTEEEWSSYMKSITERIERIQSLANALGEQHEKWRIANPPPEPFFKVI
jgi:hypothetical protein